MQLILLVEAWLTDIDSSVIRAKVIKCEAKGMFLKLIYTAVIGSENANSLASEQIT